MNKDNARSVKDSPDNEGPVCPVPKATEYHCDKDIYKVPVFRAIRSTQWNIQIIAQPF